MSTYENDDKHPSEHKAQAAAAYHGKLIDTRARDCKASKVELTMSTFSCPDLANKDRLLAARTLMQIYQYGTVLGLFAAVDRALDLFIEDKLCLDSTGDHAEVVDALFCWQRLTAQLDWRQAARVMAGVWGIANAEVPERDRNRTIVPLLADLIDALNDVCDPGGCRDHPTPGRRADLELALSAVRLDLTMNMSEWATMTTKALMAHFTTGERLLEGLAGQLHMPCYIAGGDAALRSVLALHGADLAAGGVSFVKAVKVAEAWGRFLQWVCDEDGSELPDPIPNEVCQAAWILKPVQRETLGSSVP